MPLECQSFHSSATQNNGFGDAEFRCSSELESSIHQRNEVIVSSSAGLTASPALTAKKEEAIAIQRAKQPIKLFIAPTIVYQKQHAVCKLSSHRQSNIVSSETGLRCLSYD